MKAIFKYKQHIIVFLFCLFFATLIFASNAINSQSIVAIFLFSLIFFQSSKLKANAKRNLPFLLFFAWIAISLIYTDHLDIGLKKLTKYAIIPISIFVFSFLDIRKKSVLKIFKFFVLCVLIATLYSHIVKLIDFFNNNEASFRNFFNLNYSYLALADTLDLHPTYYSFFILTAISMLLYLIPQKKSLVSKVLAVIIILYFSFFIVHLSSRITILGLYFLLLSHLIYEAYRHKKMLRGLLFLVLFHIFIILVVMNIGVTKYRFQHLIGFTYYTGYKVNDSSHKIKLWTAAFNANHNFLVGNGIGDTQATLNEQYSIAKLEKPLTDNYNSHNQYIQYYVGLGVIGFILFCFILFYYARQFFKYKNRLGLQFILIIGLLCITECLWNRHHGLVFICVMLGLLWAKNQKPELLEKESIAS